MPVGDTSSATPTIAAAPLIVVTPAAPWSAPAFIPAHLDQSVNSTHDASVRWYGWVADDQPLHRNWTFQAAAILAVVVTAAAWAADSTFIHEQFGSAVAGAAVALVIVFVLSVLVLNYARGLWHEWRRQ
jgi:hypothetical protein